MHLQLLRCPGGTRPRRTLLGDEHHQDPLSHTHPPRKPVMAPVFRHMFHYFRTRLGHLGFSHHHAWPLDFNDCIYGRPTNFLLFLVFPNPDGVSAGWHACFVRFFSTQTKGRTRSGKESTWTSFFSFSSWQDDDMGGGTASFSRRNLDHLAVWTPPGLQRRDVMCPALLPPGTGSILFFLTGTLRRFWTIPGR